MDAVERYRLAVDAAPGDPTHRYNLAAALHARGDSAGAMSVLKVGLKAMPTDPQLLYGQACVLQSIGRIEDAVVSFRTTVELDPTLAHAWYGLGTAQLAQGDDGSALACYERVVKLDPGNAVARHLIASLQEKSTVAPPIEFVRMLFDGYAERYDEHLTGTLCYRAHELTAGALLHAIRTRRQLEILDLGCGTGLFGKKIRNVASRLVGIDVSPEMLRKAEERGCYDSLEVAELGEFLARAAPASYDVVTAVDVFSYVGSLEDALANASRILRPEGLLAFTVEAGDKDYTLDQTVRYRHAKPYLDRLAAGCGFREVACRQETLRMENGYPCVGWVLVWWQGNGNTEARRGA